MKVLGIITSLFLLPSISNAQIQRVWSIAEYTSTMLPPPSGGTKVAYRTLNNSLYYWDGTQWKRIAGPGIVDTNYTVSMLGSTISLNGSGTSVDIAPYVSTSPTTIAANYIATSNGTNLVARNLFDNNTAVSILNSKPFMLGQWTTAGRPSGTAGYMGWRDGTTLEWYNGTRWAAGLESTFARGTAGSIFFADANGQITENNSSFFWNNTNIGLGIGTNSFSSIYQIKALSNINGAKGFEIENTNTGSSSETFFQLKNGSSSLLLESFSGNYTVAGLRNTGYIASGSGATAGLVINTIASAPINFSTGSATGANTRFRIGTTRNISFLPIDVVGDITSSDNSTPYTISGYSGLLVQRASNIQTGLKVRNTNTGSSSEAFINVENDAGGSFVFEAFGSGWGTTSLRNTGMLTAQNMNMLAFSTLNTSPIEFRTNAGATGVSNTRLHLSGSANRIGMFTTSPTKGLDVNSTLIVRDTMYNTLPVTHASIDAIAAWKNISGQGYALGKIAFGGGLSVSAGVLSSTWLKPELEANRKVIIRQTGLDTAIVDQDGRIIIRGESYGGYIGPGSDPYPGVVSFKNAVLTLGDNDKFSEYGTGSDSIKTVLHLNSTNLFGQTKFDFGNQIVLGKNYSGLKNYNAGIAIQWFADANNSVGGRLRILTRKHVGGENQYFNFMENGTFINGSYDFKNLSASYLSGLPDAAMISMKYLSVGNSVFPTKRFQVFNDVGTERASIDSAGLFGLNTYGAGTKTAAALGLPTPTHIAAFIPSGGSKGTIVDYPLSSLSNGIYTGSGTLASHTTRALIPSTGNLLFSQKYNTTDSAYIQVINNLDGNREVRGGLTDTLTTGFSKFRFYQDEAAESMGYEFETDDTYGTTLVKSELGGINATASENIILSAPEVRLNNGEVIMNQYGAGNMTNIDLGVSDTKFVAKFGDGGRVLDYYLVRDTFIEDVTLFSVGVLIQSCQELIITSSMTNVAPTNMEIRFPDASDEYRGKKITVTNIRKDAGAFIPQIRVVGGVSRLFYTTNTLTTAPTSQSGLDLDGTTWPNLGASYEFTCLKIDNTPSYRWVLKQR